MTTTSVRARPRRPRWILPAGVGAGVLADVAFDPVHRHLPLCPFKAMTGWDCPLCGGLRAVDQCAHGHVAAALHANVLVMTAGPALLAAYLWTRARPRARRPMPRWAVGAVVLVLLAFTVVRNMPSMQVLRPT